MSSKNTTIDQVFDVVQSQGQQIHEVLEAVQAQGKATDKRISSLSAIVKNVQVQGERTDVRWADVFKVVKMQGQQITLLNQRVDTQFTEALEAIHLLSEHMDKRFVEVENRFEKRFLRVESHMVTKTYLDDKLADLRGDLTLLTHKEDDKLLALVDLLYGKRLMTEAERQHIMALQPFAVS